jgi:hypothetical protein
MTGTEQLLTVARAYAAGAGVELSTVSSRALDDGKKLAAIEAGADILVGRLERTLQWFSDNWPSETTWPDDVPRPVPAREVEGVRA